MYTYTRAVVTLVYERGETRVNLQVAWLRVDRGLCRALPCLALLRGGRLAGYV